MTVHGSIAKWVGDLHDFCDTSWPEVITSDDVQRRLGKTDGVDERVLEGRIQKAMLVLMKERLEADPGLNRRFEKTVTWKWLAQLLTAVRLRELASVHIVKKGGGAGLRYDITELLKTYYGRQILAGLKFNVSRRRVVNKDELEQIRAACAKIKLKLPETVEPTTTEKFFNPELAKEA